MRFLCGINFPVGWAREHGYASYSSLLSWTLNKGKHCINAPFNIQCRLIIYYHREGEPFIDQDRSSHTHESYLSSIDPIRQVTYYLKYRAALEDILSEAGTGYILDDLRLAANLNHSLPASTITCLFIHAWVITASAKRIGLFYVLVLNICLSMAWAYNQSLFVSILSYKLHLVPYSCLQSQVHVLIVNECLMHVMVVL